MTKNNALGKGIMGKRLVKNFLDLIILCKLKEGPIYGYDLRRLIHGEFGIFLSPGTLYPVLYGLEKDGLIRSKPVGKKRMYSLADPSAAETFFGEFRKECSKMLQFLDIDVLAGLHRKACGTNAPLVHRTSQ